MQHLDDITAQEIRPGFFGKMIHGDQCTLAFWEIKKGSRLQEHFHPQEQVTYLISGELEMFIGGVRYLLTPGMVHVIPSNTPHNAYAHSDCQVIDAFAPARDDYK